RLPQRFLGRKTDAGRQQLAPARVVRWQGRRVKRDGDRLELRGRRRLRGQLRMTDDALLLGHVVLFAPRVFRRPLRFLRRRLFLVVIVFVALCREQLGELWGGPVRRMAPIEKSTQRRTDEERGYGAEQSHK